MKAQLPTASVAPPVSACPLVHPCASLAPYPAITPPSTAKKSLARAPILGKMSVPGLRGSFLLRDGVLGVRDGTWLLRVERRGYDLVLDRFPWAFDWLKLPWMEMAMRVEW